MLILEAPLDLPCGIFGLQDTHRRVLLGQHKSEHALTAR